MNPRRIALSIVTTGALLAFGAGSAAAAETTQQRQVDQLLALYPGSHQIGPAAVQVTPGIAALAPSAAAGTCAYRYLCVWSDAGTNGQTLAFIRCDFVNLGEISFPGGGRWNDKLSSFANNQTAGTRSHFYNYGGGGFWDLKLTSAAPQTVGNLSSYGLNDIIDGIQVC